MPNLLPMIFIALCALSLLAMLFWLWLSVRDVLAHVAHGAISGGQGVQGVQGLTERDVLLAEKQTLLLALKDLEAERESGKLGQDDYAELNARYRARAKEVLRALDEQTGPYREAARALLRDGAPTAAVSASSPAPAKQSTAPVATAQTKPVAPAGVSCSACSTNNDVDAVFCKKCGARLAEQS